MKIEKYIKELQAVAKIHPGIDVVYASDEEGNSFDEVGFVPTVGHYDKQSKEFETPDLVAAEEFQGVNAVCIN